MVKEYTGIKLRFKSPVHLGETGIGVEKTSIIAHSDTLWGAIANALIKLYANFDNFSGFVKQPANPPFILSSAFPWVKDCYYFPKPFSVSTIVRGLELSLYKDLKRTKYLPKDAFENWLNGKTLEQEDLEHIAESSNGIRSNINKIISARAALGHAAFTSNLFYIGETHFQKDAGLFFFVDFLEPSSKDIFFSSLRLLSEDGLGGRRAKGYGIFEFEEVAISIRVPDSSTHFITLSVVSPADDMIEVLSKSFYGIIERKGWSLYPNMEQTRWLPIQMLLEGSVFPVKPVGRVLNVAPDDWMAKNNPIYRNGLAFPIPMVYGGGYD